MAEILVRERIGKSAQPGGDLREQGVELIASGGELGMGERGPVGIAQNCTQDFGVPGMLSAVLSLR